MTVFLPTRMTWRTSARPSTTSTISGSRRPLSAALDVVGQLVDDVVQPDVDALGLGGATGGVGDLRVLKPTTMAFDAAASMMSLSVMSPAPSSRTLSRISSWSSCSSAWVMAPSEPDTSDFRMIRSSLAWPALDLAVEVLERRPAARRQPLRGLTRPCAVSTMRPGVLLVADDAQDVAGHRDVRQAEDDHGASTAPAFVTRLPGSFSKRANAPEASPPTTMMSPTLQRAGLDERGRDRRPRPLSSLASTHRCRPRRAWLGLELPADRRRASSRSARRARSASRPTPGRAARRRRTPRRRCRASVSSVLTRSGFESGLVISNT